MISRNITIKIDSYNYPRPSHKTLRYLLFLIMSLMFFHFSSDMAYAYSSFDPIDLWGSRVFDLDDYANPGQVTYDAGADGYLMDGNDLCDLYSDYMFDTLYGVDEGAGNPHECRMGWWEVSTRITDYYGVNPPFSTAVAETFMYEGCDVSWWVGGPGNWVFRCKKSCDKKIVFTGVNFEFGSYQVPPNNRLISAQCKCSDLTSDDCSDIIDYNLNTFAFGGPTFEEYDTCGFISVDNGCGSGPGGPRWGQIWCNCQDMSPGTPYCGNSPTSCMSVPGANPPVCGDGIYGWTDMPAGSDLAASSNEQCDLTAPEGLFNVVKTYEDCVNENPGYDETCLYCDSNCILHAYKGPYCPDGTDNGLQEACDEGVASYTGDCVNVDNHLLGRCYTAFCGDGFRKDGFDGYSSFGIFTPGVDEECDPDSRCSDNPYETCGLYDDCSPGSGNCVVIDWGHCKSDCTLNYCGDGVLDVENEECDDGNDDSGDSCTNECKIAECGDGYIWDHDGGTEECDDGGTDNGDGCDSDCIEEICGNGKVQYNEQCDDGDLNINDDCPDGVPVSQGGCQNAACGDGFLWNQGGGTEECDDGNSNLNDDCPDGIPFSLGGCHNAVCGDGFLWNQGGGTEECDDGDFNLNDNCPDGVPVSLGGCQDAACGDGFLWNQDGGIEQCDDGLVVDTYFSVDPSDDDGQCVIDAFSPENTDISCKWNSCGDGYLWSQESGGPEFCDDGYRYDTFHLVDPNDDDGNCVIDENDPGASCNWNRCGDGYLWKPASGGTEECDDSQETDSLFVSYSGENDDGYCIIDHSPGGLECKNNECGDGYLWMASSGGTEECDDSLITDTFYDIDLYDDDGQCVIDAADPGNPDISCKWNDCGDGYLWSQESGGPESCDDNYQYDTFHIVEPLDDDAQCVIDESRWDASCEVNVCGDGYLNGSTEECDDADTMNFDYCIIDYSVSYECMNAICGDGYLWNFDGGTEECDDGNDDETDGCLSDCSWDEYDYGDCACDEPLLTAYFKFEENTPDNDIAIDSSCSGNAGNLYGTTRLLMHMNELTLGETPDETAYRNNGLVTGSLLREGGGVNINSLEFDGVDDYIEVNNAESLSISGDLTFEAWIKPDAGLSGFVGPAGQGYNREITLSLPTPEDDYQVKIVLDSSFSYDHLAYPSDGADVRFYDEDYNKLPYWIEEWNEGGSSTLWVKVRAAGTDNFFIAYGSQDAYSESNGDDVFELFDDFDGSFLDTSKWYGRTNPNSDGTITVGNATTNPWYYDTAYEHGLKSKKTWGFDSLLVETKIKEHSDLEFVIGFRMDNFIYFDFVGYDRDGFLIDCNEDDRDPLHYCLFDDGKYFGTEVGENEFADTKMSFSVGTSRSMVTDIRPISSNYFVDMVNTESPLGYLVFASKIYTHTTLYYALVRKFTQGDDPIYMASIGPESKTPAILSKGYTSYNLYANSTTAVVSLNGQTLKSDLGSDGINEDSGEASQWHHVVVTYFEDSGEKKAELFIDGSSRDLITVGDEIMLTPNSLIIGDSFKGLIDEVAVYSKRLSLEEIQSHKSNRMPDFVERIAGRKSKGISFHNLEEYIGVPDSDLLDIAGNFTIESWVKSQSNKLIRAGTYKREINLDIPTSKDGLQVKLVLDSTNFDYSGVASPDGHDIRFYLDEDLTKPVPYFIQRWKSGALLASTIWVKIPDAGVSRIYIHYGDPAAQPESNPDEVFEFYDDFNDYSDLNDLFLLGGWSYSEGGGTIDFVGSADDRDLRFQCQEDFCLWDDSGSTIDSPVLVYRDIPDGEFIVESRIKSYTGTTDGIKDSQAGMTQFSSLNDASFWGPYRWEGTCNTRLEGRYQDNYVDSSQSEVSLDSCQVTGNLKLIVDKGSSPAGDYFYTNYFFHDQSGGMHYYWSNNRVGLFLKTFWWWGPKNFEVRFDYFRIRKFVPIEPQIDTISAEQPASESNILIKKGDSYTIFINSSDVVAYVGDSVLSALLVEDAWNHLALTCDSTGSTMHDLYLYVNGNLEMSTQYNGLITTNNDELVIGRGIDTSTIDEFGIYNRTLSEEEIRRHHDSYEEVDLCTPPGCGDGFVNWTAGEECDFGFGNFEGTFCIPPIEQNRCTCRPVYSAPDNLGNCSYVNTTGISEDITAATLTNFSVDKEILDDILISYYNPALPISAFYMADTEICEDSEINKFIDSECYGRVDENIMCNITLTLPFDQQKFNQIQTIYGCVKINNIWVRSLAEYLNITPSCNDTLLSPQWGEDCEPPNGDFALYNCTPPDDPSACMCLEGFVPDGTGGCYEDTGPVEGCGDNILSVDEECEYSGITTAIPGLGDVPNDFSCPGRCNESCLCEPCDYCGDGTVQPFEMCDYNALESICPGRCNESCECEFEGFCGDAYLQYNETCDYNLSDQTWLPELGWVDNDWACPGLCNENCECDPCPPEEYCGDGVLQFDEMCEYNLTDQSYVNGLGWVDNDWACPGRCNETCGCDPCPESPDCDDEILDDPWPCWTDLGTYDPLDDTQVNCSNISYSVCAKCIHPDAEEICDGVDNDCNYLTDEPPLKCVWWNTSISEDILAPLIDTYSPDKIILDDISMTNLSDRPKFDGDPDILEVEPSAIIDFYLANESVLTSGCGGVPPDYVNLFDGASCVYGGVGNIIDCNLRLPSVGLFTNESFGLRNIYGCVLVNDNWYNAWNISVAEYLNITPSCNDTIWSPQVSEECDPQDMDFAAAFCIPPDQPNKCTCEPGYKGENGICIRSVSLNTTFSENNETPSLFNYSEYRILTDFINISYETTLEINDYYLANATLGNNECDNFGGDYLYSHLNTECINLTATNISCNITLLPEFTDEEFDKNITVIGCAEMFGKWQKSLREYYVVTSSCGDGRVHSPNFYGLEEECDGENLNGMTCRDLGYVGGGIIGCYENCTFNTTACSNETNLTIDYPEGIYELKGLYPNEVTIDTFEWTVVNISPIAGDTLHCTFIDANQLDHSYQTTFSADQHNVNYTWSYKLQGTPYDCFANPTAPPGTDPSGHYDRSWYLKNCSLRDAGGDLLQSNATPHPIYVKTCNWTYYSGPAKKQFDLINCFLSKKGFRTYFSHNDASEADCSFTFRKGASLRFEGICDDGISNEVESLSLTDCADNDCYDILFFPYCLPHPLDIEYDADGFATGFSVIDITGYGTYPTVDPCTSDVGNICYIDDIGLGMSLYYTLSASTDGFFKVRFVKPDISDMTFMGLQNLSGFNITNITMLGNNTEIYGLGPDTVLDYKWLLGNHTFLANSNQQGGQSFEFVGDLDMVLNLNLTMAPEYEYHNVTAYGFINPNELADSLLYVDVGSDRPSNDDEADPRLPRNEDNFIQGTTAISNVDDNSCWDLVDNDLNYDGIDCTDMDCDQVVIGKTSQDDDVRCEFGIELTCWDGVDNDGDNYVDCDDSDCNGQIGAYLLEGTGGTPVKHFLSTSQIAVYCENDAKNGSQGQQAEGNLFFGESISSCLDRFDNDADRQAWGMQIKCSYANDWMCWNKQIDCWDPWSCWGRDSVENPADPICPLFEEDCTDGIDNDYDNHFAHLDSSNWLGIMNPRANFTGAFRPGRTDCDDYDCHGSTYPSGDYICSAALTHITEWDGINNDTCFDLVDNDLDAYYWGDGAGNYLQNLSAGLDCNDPDCWFVTQPGTGKQCFPSEFLVLNWNWCSNAKDDDDDDGTDAYSGIDCNDAFILEETTDCWKMFGNCGPCPLMENITYDSCADTVDNDVDRGLDIFDKGSNYDSLDYSGYDCRDVDCREGEEIGTYSAKRCTIAENSFDLCSDNFDNDGDGLVDCRDSQCDGIVDCRFGSEAPDWCDDNLDNDADTVVDCADNECWGVDYDGDTVIDCPGSWNTAGCLNTPVVTILDEIQFRVSYYRILREDVEYWSIHFAPDPAGHPDLYTGPIEMIIGEGAYSGKAIPFDNISSNWVISGGSVDNFGFVVEMYTHDTLNDEFVMVFQNTSPVNDSDPLDLRIDIPTGPSDLGEHEISLNLKRQGAGVIAPMTITLLEDQPPVIEQIIIEPYDEANDEIELIYGDTLSFRGIANDTDRGDSQICRCYMQINGSSGVYDENITDGNCLNTLGFGHRDDVYNIAVSPRDRPSNIGGNLTRQFNVIVKPKDITEDYKLNRSFYNSSLGWWPMRTGDFTFITGDGDQFDDASCIITVETVDGSGIGVTATPVVSLYGNKANCSADFTLPANVLNNDNMYLIRATITDTDGDTITSDPKVFYVCNDYSSYSDTPGKKWTCAKADLDNDGATEGLLTDLYNDPPRYPGPFACDNCPGLHNPLQSDDNANGFGNPCEPPPLCGDGWVEGWEECDYGPNAPDYDGTHCIPPPLFGNCTCERGYFAHEGQCLLIANTSISEDIDAPLEIAYFPDMVVEDNITVHEIYYFTHGHTDVSDYYLANASVGGSYNNCNCPGAPDDPCEHEFINSSCDPRIDNVIECEILIAANYSQFNQKAEIYGCVMIEGEWYITHTEYLNVSSKCGDGFEVIGEECDDGNTISGDGCSADCQLECVVDNLSFKLLDDGDNLAYPLELVKINGSIIPAGDCTDAQHVQINASDDTLQCLINWDVDDFTGVHNSSLFILQGDDYFEALWTVPDIPQRCLGRTVNATSSALFDNLPIPAGVRVSNVDYDPVGGFNFPESICGDGNVTGNEECDDGGVCTGDPSVECNSNDDCVVAGGNCIAIGGDGCSEDCTWECIVDNVRISLVETMSVNGYAEIGEVVKLNGSILDTANCSDASFIQVNASDEALSCFINWTSAHLMGMENTAGPIVIQQGDTYFEGFWTIPAIPERCLGKTIYGNMSALYDIDPNAGGMNISNVYDALGSFTFIDRCRIESISFMLNDIDGDDLADQGEWVDIEGDITGDCTDANWAYVNASNGTSCIINWSNANIEGLAGIVNILIGDMRFDASWQVPATPFECAGKNVSAMNGSLYMNEKLIDSNVTSVISASGSIRFPPWPQICGDGYIVGDEECDYGSNVDHYIGTHCIPPGTEGNCTCNRKFTVPNLIGNCSWINTTGLSEIEATPSMAIYSESLEIEDDISISNFYDPGFPITDYYLADSSLVQCDDLNTSWAEGTECSYNPVSGNNWIDCSINISRIFNEFNEMIIIYGCAKIGGEWINSTTEYLNVSPICGDMIYSPEFGEQCDPPDGNFELVNCVRPPDADECLCMEGYVPDGLGGCVLRIAMANTTLSINPAIPNLIKISKNYTVKLPDDINITNISFSPYNIEDFYLMHGGLTEVYCSDFGGAHLNELPGTTCNLFNDTLINCEISFPADYDELLFNVTQIVFGCVKISGGWYMSPAEFYKVTPSCGDGWLAYPEMLGYEEECDPGNESFAGVDYATAHCNPPGHPEQCLCEVGYKMDVSNPGHCIAKECNDHIDNDGDNHCDIVDNHCDDLTIPGDPGCDSRDDDSEYDIFCGDNITQKGYEDCDDGLHCADGVGCTNYLGICPDTSVCIPRDHGTCAHDCINRSKINESLPPYYLLNKSMYNVYDPIPGTLDNLDYTEMIKFMLLDFKFNPGMTIAYNPLYYYDSVLHNYYLSPNNCLESIKANETCVQLWYIYTTEMPLWGPTNDWDPNLDLYDLPEDIEVGQALPSRPINPLEFYGNFTMVEPHTGRDLTNYSPSFYIRMIPKRDIEIPVGQKGPQNEEDYGLIRAPSNATNMTYWHYNQTLTDTKKWLPMFRAQWNCMPGYVAVLENMTCIPGP